MSEYIVDYELIPLKWRDGFGLSDVDLTEEIVRCRDCEHLEVFHPFDVYRLKPSEHAEYHCTSSQFSNWDFPIEVEPDGFCAWGERKEVDA